MKITKREILASISIIAVMLTVGFLISSVINNNLHDEYQEYDTAIQIDNDSELFQYGINTSVGNAFVSGKLKAIDPVSYDDINGEYAEITKVTEKYTMHTRLVTHTRTNSEGKTETYTTTEVYYSWDEIKRESFHCSKISFLDIEFLYGVISFPPKKEIDTIYEDNSVFESVGDIRNVFYGSPAECEGTVYAQLSNNTIKNAEFFNDKSIEETIKMLESKAVLIAFWILWVVFIGLAVFGFCYLDNWWLEKN